VEKSSNYYKAEMMVNGKSRDLFIDPSGAVVEVEGEVVLDAVPEQVRTAIR
jgi:hypothetical protein